MRIAIAHHGAIENVLTLLFSTIVAKCYQNRPDLILMDLDLPAINGVEKILSLFSKVNF